MKSNNSFTSRFLLFEIPNAETNLYKKKGKQNVNATIETSFAIPAKCLLRVCPYL